MYAFERLTVRVPTALFVFQKIATLLIQVELDHRERERERDRERKRERDREKEREREDTRRGEREMRGLS